MHFTPTSGSWLNLVEVWFGIIERQAIHRGTFGSVRDLNSPNLSVTSFASARPRVSPRPVPGDEPGVGPQ